MSTAAAHARLPRVATAPTKTSQYRQKLALENRQRRERLDAKINAQLKALNVTTGRKRAASSETPPTARSIAGTDIDLSAVEQMEHEHQVNTFRTRVITLTSNKVHLEQKVHNLQQQIAQLQEEKKAVSKHAAYLQLQLTRAESQLKSRGELRSKPASRAPPPQELHQSAPSGTHPATTQKLALENENSRMRAQLAELATLVQQQKQAAQQAEAIQKENKKLREEVSTLAMTVRMQQETLNQRDQVITELTKKCNTQAEELSSVSQHLELLQHAALEQSGISETALDKAAITEGELRQALAEARAEIERLQDQRAAENGDIDEDSAAFGDDVELVGSRKAVDFVNVSQHTDQSDDFGDLADELDASASAGRLGASMKTVAIDDFEDEISFDDDEESAQPSQPEAENVANVSMDEVFMLSDHMRESLQHNDDGMDVTSFALDDVAFTAFRSSVLSTKPSALSEETPVTTPTDTPVDTPADTPADEESFAMSVPERGVPELLADLDQAGDVSQVLAVFESLSSWCRQSAAAVHELVAGGGLPKLQTAAESYATDEKILISYVLNLSAVVHHLDDTALDCFIEMSPQVDTLVLKIISALSANVELTDKALEVLARIPRSTAAYEQWFSGKMTGVVLDQLRTHEGNESLVAHGCSLLSAVTTPNSCPVERTAQIAVDLSETGGVLLLIAILQRWSRVERIVLPAMSALYSVLALYNVLTPEQDSKYTDTFMSNKGAEAVLAAARAHLHHNAIQEYAFLTIRRVATKHVRYVPEIRSLEPGRQFIQSNTDNAMWRATWCYATGFDDFCDAVRDVVGDIVTDVAVCGLDNSLWGCSKGTSVVQRELEQWVQLVTGGNAAHVTVNGTELQVIRDADDESHCAQGISPQFGAVFVRTRQAVLFFRYDRYSSPTVQELDSCWRNDQQQRLAALDVATSLSEHQF